MDSSQVNLGGFVKNVLKSSCYHHAGASPAFIFTLLYRCDQLLRKMKNLSFSVAGVPSLSSVSFLGCFESYSKLLLRVIHRRIPL
jgi:hypothetical protein